MSRDEIRLDDAAGAAYYGVAHLVLGGLAARLDLTVEHLEDLQLALDGLLDRRDGGAGGHTSRFASMDGEPRGRGRAVQRRQLRAELRRGARRRLSTCGGSSTQWSTAAVLEDATAATWVELRKQTGRAGRASMAADDKILLRRYHEDGDLAAREQLIERYMSLVRSLARRYSYRGEQLDDLVQIGAIGLIKAIDRFDVERGVELTTYATPNIIGEIKRHFRDKGWSVRVPRGLQELNVQLSKLVEQLTVQLGRSPTIPELAKAAGVEEEEVLEALESGRAYSSVSLSTGGGSATRTVSSTRSSRSATIEHEYEISEDRAVLAPGFQGARRARAEDPAPALLQRPDAVADRAADRHLADARLAPDPAIAGEDPRRDRRRVRSSVARAWPVRAHGHPASPTRSRARPLVAEWAPPASGLADPPLGPPASSPIRS